MNSFSFQYSEWYVLLCIALGAAYAATLYFKHSFIKDPRPWQKKMMVALGVVRFLAVTMIALLLLAPFIKSKFTETQKPIVLFVQDNSESVKNNFSAEDSANYAASVKQLNEKLGENFTVKEYSFSESLNPGVDFSFSGKLSNLSGSLYELFNLYSNQNVGAVVLASDGIYNKGSNPLYDISNIKFPIYTVALGDTTPRKDLKLDKVFYNKIVYLNDKFKIRADVSSDDMPSASTELQVTDLSDKAHPKKLESRKVTFQKNQSYISEDFVLNALTSGVLHLQIALSPVQGEFTKANNYKDIFIDVLDARQKILIVANSPHPDVAAIKEAIESNKNYEVSVKMVSEVVEVKPEDANLVILHQIPSQQNPAAKFLESLKTISTFYIIGGQSSLPKLNDIQKSLQITGGAQGSNEVTATIDENFSLFTLSDDLKRKLSDYPPLSAPYGEYQPAPGTKIFLSQKIGTVKTAYPLLVFDESQGRKTGLLCAEGIWRWRLYDYLQNRSHDIFNEMITKTVQYLSVREDKRQFRVRIANNVFYENEPVSFQAELYNDSYELINIPDAAITLTDESGNEFPYTFNKAGNAYSLDAGNFQVGDYSFRAKTKFGGKELSFDGKFTIIPVQVEAFNTVANHQLLYQLSEKSGGKMYAASALETLSGDLINNNDLKPLVYSTFKTEALINFKWLFAIFFGLLALEWFVRKYEGGY